MCGIDKYKTERSQNKKGLDYLQCSDFGSGVSIKPGECLKSADGCIRQGCQLKYFYIEVWWHGENNCRYRLVPPVVAWMWQSCFFFCKTWVWHKWGSLLHLVHPSVCRGGIWWLEAALAQRESFPHGNLEGTHVGRWLFSKPNRLRRQWKSPCVKCPATREDTWFPFPCTISQNSTWIRILLSKRHDKKVEKTLRITFCMFTSFT